MRTGIEDARTALIVGGFLVGCWLVVGWCLNSDAQIEAAT